jgi:hypothetical protein
MVDLSGNDRTWIERYRGLSLDALLVLAREDGRPVRVIRRGEPMSADRRCARLNVVVDDDGDPIEVSAG